MGWANGTWETAAGVNGFPLPVLPRQYQLYSLLAYSKSNQSRYAGVNDVSVADLSWACVVLLLRNDSYDRPATAF